MSLLQEFKADWTELSDEGKVFFKIAFPFMVVVLGYSLALIVTAPPP
jgi:hypothetical protein